jgi:flagellin
MSVINTNTKSIVAQNALTVNSRAMSKAMEQLSTGKRINSAKDDAAGLAIASTMTAQIRGLNQAVRNANDGISLLQTAEGAMIEQTNMMQRMRELAVQAANDTVTDDQKGYLDDEYQALLDEIDRIGGATQWNGENVLDKTGARAGAGLYTFQVGADASQEIKVQIGEMKTTAATGLLKDLDSTSITTSALSNTAIGKIDTALDAMNAQRSDIGAGINTLTYAADNLANVSQNATESRSRILDTDYAATTTELARTQIISQAATAMLAQANQAPQSVLSLLR